MNWQSLLKGLLGGNVDKGTKPKNVVSGFGCGFVFVLLAFALVYYSVSGIKEESKIVETLEYKPAVEVTEEDRGLTMLYGNLETDEALTATIDKCYSERCQYPGDEEKFENLLYYSITFERYEVVKETKKETDSDGDTREVTEYNEEWVELSRDSMWADVNLDGIDVEAKNAKSVLTYEISEIGNVYVEGLDGVETYGRNVSAQVGDVRATITYLEDDDREFTVVGELRSGKMNGGEVFIVSDLSDTELVSHLASAESSVRWGTRILAWILMTIGFTSILGPILALTDFIPVVGGAARTLATVVSGIVAAALVLSTVFLLNFWWLCMLSWLILLIAGAAGFAMWYKNKEDGGGSTPKMESKPENEMSEKKEEKSE